MRLACWPPRRRLASRPAVAPGRRTRAHDGYYRVQSGGDWPLAVARRHKRTVRELTRWNQLPSADRIEGRAVAADSPTVAAPAPAQVRPAAARWRWGIPRAWTTARRRERRLPASACNGPADEAAITAGHGPPASEGLRIQHGAWQHGARRGQEARRSTSVTCAATAWRLVGHQARRQLADGLRPAWTSPRSARARRCPAGRRWAAWALADSELHFEVRNNGKPVDPARTAARTRLTSVRGAHATACSITICTRVTPLKVLLSSR
ncbi:hypothetical protein ACU4GD_12855 [Cupriavidus basilensis]